MAEPYRDPYPSLREQAYWFYVRWFTTRDVPEKAWVQLSCPHAEEVIATENTVPDHEEMTNDGKIAGYDCDECGEHHRWLWGPPAPIYLGEHADDVRIPEPRTGEDLDV